MLKMYDSVSVSYREKGAKVILLFKPNYEYGFYYSKELVHLKKFADEVEKIQIVDCNDNVYSNDNEIYGDIREGYIKVYYKDGTSKIIDFLLNEDYEYYFFETNAE